MPGSNSDKGGGLADRIGGKINELTGKATHDRELEAVGKADQQKGMKEEKGKRGPETSGGRKPEADKPER